jgi:hypothetical protein
MKRTPAAIIASGLALAGCDSPGSIPAPDPVGRWQATRVDGTVVGTIEIKADGDFSAEFRPPFAGPQAEQMKGL